LHIFLAAVDEGIFPAAGRRLLRVQSAISEAVNTLNTSSASARSTAAAAIRS
jgi:DNA-binding transcriptional LysR family regulator